MKTDATMKTPELIKTELIKTKENKLFDKIKANQGGNHPAAQGAQDAQAGRDQLNQDKPLELTEAETRTRDPSITASHRYITTGPNDRQGKATTGCDERAQATK